MNEKEFLIAYLAATLGLPSDKVAESLYKKADDGTLTDELQEGALDAVKLLDTERVKKLKPDTKQFFDNGYKKAQADVSEHFEKMLREKFGIDDQELKGEQLIVAGLEKVAKPKMDDDKVKLHPLFVSREKELLALAEAARQEGQSALEQFKAEQAKAQILARAQAKARDILLSKKPVLEEDQRVANYRIGKFLDELTSFDFEEVNGDFIPTKDGKRVEDNHLHPVSFDKIVNDLAESCFVFQVQSAKGNGGNQNQPGGSITGHRIPKTEEEMVDMVSKAQTYEEKKAIIDSFEKTNGAIPV